MRLTKSNYYSPEANKAYWSASFVKAMTKCPAAAMACLRGEYQPPITSALLIGSYVDAAFEGKKAMSRFCAAHPEILNSRTGELKSEFKQARDMIDRAVSDAVFADYVKGRKQVIRTGKIGGLPFKCKMDIYRKGERIVDIKTARDMRSVYTDEKGRVSFAEAYEYPLQMAIYQAVEGNNLPCFLAVITKEDPPDIEIIEIPQDMLDTEMEILRSRLPYFDAVRQGVVQPDRCEKCAYCRATKKLIAPVSLDDPRFI